MLGKRRRSSDGAPRKRVKRLRGNATFLCHERAVRMFRKRKGVLFTGRLHAYVSNKTVRRKCRDLGHAHGMCHLSVFNPVGQYRGLHVLFRVPSDRKVTANELAVLSKLSQSGYAVAVCSTAKSADAALGHYLSGKHATLGATLLSSSGGLEIPRCARAVRNPKPSAPAKRKGEYLMHATCVSRLVTARGGLIVDGQPQGNLHRYQSDSYYTTVGNSAGYAKGCCDLLVWEPRGAHNGFAAEFKVGRNTLMPDQKKFAQKLEAFGWYVCAPRSVEEFVKEFESYYGQ